MRTNLYKNISKIRQMVRKRNARNEFTGMISLGNYSGSEEERLFNTAASGNLVAINSLLKSHKVRAILSDIDNAGEVLCSAVMSGHIQAVDRFLEIEQVRISLHQQHIAQEALRLAVVGGHPEIATQLRNFIDEKVCDHHSTSLRDLPPMLDANASLAHLRRVLRQSKYSSQSASSFFAVLPLQMKTLLKNTHLSTLLSDPDHAVEILCSAVLMGKVEFVEILLGIKEVETSLEPTAVAREVLRLAVEHGNLKVIRKLLENPSIRPRANDQVVFLGAIKRGNVPIVTELLKIDQIKQISKNGVMGLRIAIQFDHKNVTSLLLAKGADGFDALKYAIHFHRCDMGRRLLALAEVQKSLVNLVKVRELLTCAVMHGNHDGLNQLLQIKCIREHLHDRRCASVVLGAAINRGKVEILNRLLELKLEGFITKYSLLCAIKFGHLAIVDRLLMIKKVQAEASQSSLLVAVIRGRHEICSRLLKVDAIRALANYDNNRALRLALDTQNPEIERMLLSVDHVISSLSENDFECAVKHQRAEACYAIACHLWPQGRRSVPDKYRQYLPLIKEGLGLIRSNKEAAFLLSSVMRRRAKVGVSRSCQSSGHVSSVNAPNLACSNGVSQNNRVGFNGISERAHVLIADFLGFHGSGMMRRVYDLDEACVPDAGGESKHQEQSAISNKR